MTPLLHLSIATPQRKVLDVVEVESVSGPGVSGDFCILPNHAPFLSKLNDGLLKYRLDGKDYFVAINNAFLDVADNEVTVVSEAAILPEEADQRKAEEARAKAKAQLEKRLEGTDFRMVEAELRRALLELKLIEHIRK